MDYFEWFGLAPRLELDAAELEARFYRLSRQLHPDRYLRATPAERARALAASAELNDAYRTLRDPVARAEYVLARAGAADGPADPELLDEMFELNEERERGGEAFRARVAGMADEAERRLGAEPLVLELQAAMRTVEALAAEGDRSGRHR